MKIEFLFFLILIFIVGCTSDDDTSDNNAISYPAIYKYDGLSFGPTSYFEVAGTGVFSIISSSRLDNIDGNLRTEVETFEVSPIDEFELINEAQLRIRTTSNFDTTLTYTRLGNELAIPGADITANIVNSNQELQICFVYEITLYTSNLGMQEFGVLNIDDCSGTSPLDYAAFLRDKYDMLVSTGDTIIVNTQSNIVFTKQ